MANRVVYSWIAKSTTAICALQTTTGAATLSLNGDLSSFINGFFGPITLNGISRTISLTSANNLSARSVTITGFRDGAPVTETRSGPNANTVETTALFNVITSVTVSGAVTALSVGTGSSGQVNWFKIDSQNAIMNLASQVVVSGTITYSFQVTCDVPNNAGTNPPAVVFAPNIFTPVAAQTSATTNQLAAITTPIKYCNVIVSSSTGAATLIWTALQQGLHS